MKSSPIGSRTITALVAVLFVLSSVPARSEDLYEPNDTRETAYEIDITDGDWISGSAELATDNDLDWYVFTGGHNQYVSCVVSSQADIAFSLYFGDETLVSVDDFYGGLEEKLENFRLDKDGSYHLCVAPSGSLPKTSDSSMSYSLEIILETEHVITGTVADSQSGTPLPIALVAVEYGEVYEGETDVDGMFEITLPGAHPGDAFAVSVQCEGYLSRITEGVFSDEDTSIITVELDPLSGKTRTILLEEFTATWCVWCPYASDLLEELTRNQGNIIPLAYHISDEMSTTEGSKLANTFNPDLPQALIDRTQFSGNSDILVNREDWERRCIERSQEPPNLSINLECGYDVSTRTVDCAAIVCASATMDGSYRINVVVCEDSLEYTQQIAGQSYSTISPYYHVHVVRDMITGAFGEVFNDKPIGAETCLRRDYSFTLDDAIDENRAEIVVFVHEDVKSGFGPVEQAAKIPIMENETSVENSAPLSFSVSPPFPNPFNPATTIEYDLPSNSHVRLTVHDILGRAVRVLVDEKMSAGTHEAVWNGRDSRGNILASGVYFYRITANGSSCHGKMMLVR